MPKFESQVKLQSMMPVVQQLQTNFTQMQSKWIFGFLISQLLKFKYTTAVYENSATAISPSK
jgi:hypothetical protein